MLKIYNASAGSGKTYVLVKEYLKVALTSKAYLPQRGVLSITFTNKAAEEMKSRILDALMRFSNPKILKSNDSLFTDLANELKISSQQLHLKAGKLIRKILHNYGSFEVSTIDKFNQKLIRTFAYDLGIPMNFEVELDTEYLLQQAVDRLIYKAGQAKGLTEVLLDYAVFKFDDDKSWDIALDLNKAAQLLTKETELSFLKSLEDKDLEAFAEFKEEIETELRLLSPQISSTAIELLQKFSKNGLLGSDFRRGSLPKHFLALANNRFEVNFEAVWQKNIETTEFYPQKTSARAKATIDRLRPEIITVFHNTKKGIYRLRYLQNLLTNLTPLSVLTLIKKELNALKEEHNLLLISEFNSVISKEIKSQPTTFLYERIGEKYTDYFIDEFQDTSAMQWENLIPLIKNALSSTGGSLMLVGDPKQAIYRWRGGDPDQFINLINGQSPFTVKPSVYSLPSNYRSCKSIVNFNNAFFQHLSNCIFSDPIHQQIYQTAQQKSQLSKPGYVHMSFLKFDKDDDKSSLYAEKVYQTINKYKSLSKTAAYNDICILVRKHSEGVALAQYLADKNIPIVSDQSMLVSASTEVQFIIAVFKYVINPEDSIAQLYIINVLIDRYQIDTPHQFRLKYLSLKPKVFFKKLACLGIHFDDKALINCTIYEAAEQVISAFNLVKSSDAHVQFFLDFIFELIQKDISSITQFLDCYEQKKDSLSIVSPSGVEAIQIMTIHKAKGLEFPVVIFPFANLDIYREKEPREWMPTAQIGPHFPYFLMNFNKDFKYFGKAGNTRFYEHKAKLELDNINLLYVALTRAEEQLYIIGAAPTDSEKTGTLKTYSDLLISFLKFDNKWRPGVLEYSYGCLEPLSIRTAAKQITLSPRKFISSQKAELNIPMVTKAGDMNKNPQKEAIKKGNLIHFLLSKVYTSIDIESALENFTLGGMISTTHAIELKKILYAIVNHPELRSFYSGELEVFNEREIITESAKIIIPDRLIVQKNGHMVIIDYKTGQPDQRYHHQLQNYAATIEKMGYHVEKKILIYIYPELTIKIV